MAADAWAALLGLLPGEWGIFEHWFVWSFLLRGLWLSVKIAGISIVLSLGVGVIMAVARLAPVRLVRWLAGTYVETFRATPLLLLLFFIFFGATRVDTTWLLDVPFGSLLVDPSGQLDRLPSAILALTLYNSAVVAEIMRAGILSISKGTVEAARSLGLSYLQSMRYVAVPMALRRMAPGLVSQLITLFKDTSLASLIGVVELLRRGGVIYNTTSYSLLYGNGNSITIEVLTVVALMYFIPCYLLSLLSQRLEQGPEQRARYELPAAIRVAPPPRDLG
ncbi:MAG: amino acid ABC transporter permease [Chloroflexi bacterium]|nr:amino acid ABC transporter permease [Chloroflexota bacterium]